MPPMVPAGQILGSNSLFQLCKVLFLCRRHLLTDDEYQGADLWYATEISRSGVIMGK